MKFSIERIEPFFNEYPRRILTIIIFFTAGLEIFSMSNKIKIKILADGVGKQKAQNFM